MSIKCSYRYFFPKYKDKMVKRDDCFRIKIAEEQVKLQPVSKEMIKEHIRNFLDDLSTELDYEIREVNLTKTPIKRGFYFDFVKKDGLKDKKDIVWMKFTKEEKGEDFLGVVATGNDINFNANNASGKIIKSLGKNWNEDYVLIVLLKKMPSYLNRQLVESGIGNYLISKEVPILDYFSQNL